MLNQKQVCCITTVFMLALLSTTILAVAAQVNDSTAALESRASPYPVGYAVDPVGDAIKEFRAQGLTDEQIVQELEKLGMWWNPLSGARGLGIFIPEDQAEKYELPPRRYRAITPELQFTLNADLDDNISESESPINTAHAVVGVISLVAVILSFALFAKRKVND
jgi:hypothetical protein